MGEDGAIMGMLLAPLQGSSHKMAVTPCFESTAKPLANLLLNAIIAFAFWRFNNTCTFRMKELINF